MAKKSQSNDLPKFLRQFEVEPGKAAQLKDRDPGWMDTRDMQELGILNLVTEGVSRFNVREREVSANGLALADVTLLQEEDAERATPPPPLLVELLQKLIERVGDEHFPSARHFDDANWVSYRLAEILPIKLSVKQKLLEVNDSDVRLGVIAEFLKQHGVMPRE